MTKEGKLYQEIIDKIIEDCHKKGRVGTFTGTEIMYVLDDAKKDILRKIKEYEYEDIPDDIMKDKIIEWFGSDDDD